MLAWSFYVFAHFCSVIYFETNNALIGALQKLQLGDGISSVCYWGGTFAGSVLNVARKWENERNSLVKKYLSTNQVYNQKSLKLLFKVKK